MLTDSKNLHAQMAVVIYAARTHHFRILTYSSNFKTGFFWAGFGCLEDVDDPGVNPCTTSVLVAAVASATTSIGLLDAIRRRRRFVESAAIGVSSSSAISPAASMRKAFFCLRSRRLALRSRRFNNASLGSASLSYGAMH